MNKDNHILQEICQLYGLGELIAPPRKVAGGLLHYIWQVTTHKDKYAIKEINTAVEKLKARNTISAPKYEEIAAAMLQQGINTIVPLVHDNDYAIMLNQRLFLVYPWLAGEVQNLTSLSAKRAQSIAKLLVDMHHANIIRQDLPIPNWRGFGQEQWHNLFVQSRTKYINNDMHDSYQQVLAYDRFAQQFVAYNPDQLVISHRDLIASNIIWAHEDIPIVIDWEYVGFISPALELFIVALNWAFISPNQFNWPAFKVIVHEYKAANPKLPDFSLELVHLYFGYVLDWIEFNWRRLLAFPEAIDLANNEIRFSLQALSWVDSHTQLLADAWNKP